MQMIWVKILDQVEFGYALLMNFKKSKPRV